jgi:cytochrome b6-f complex iron-sulfur subunit
VTQLVSRRDFLKILNRLLAVTGLTVVLGPIIAYFYPPELEETPTEPVPAGLLTDLPLGASQTVRYGRYPALIIHTPAGLRAYSAVCTHFACLVKWDPTQAQISCPCHDGFFAAEDGQVISGPPPSPLEPLPVTVIEGQIYVGGKA